MAIVKLGSKAVGSIVKIGVNGTLCEFIVVHQGLPSGMYDASCNGTWVLMKDCLGDGQWHSSDVNDYANSTIHSYLNSTFLNLIDANIRAQIKQVKIPYRPGGGTGGTVNSGANGLSAKVFLLSGREVGYTQSNVNKYICNDGAKLSYFTDGNGTGEKKARYNVTAVHWWLRSPHVNYIDFVWIVNSGGSAATSNCSAAHYYLRPALILPSNLLISDDGTISTNTAPTTPASINVPGSINGGNTITVSWEASSDAEGNLEGYIVERSINGATSWTQIYQGNGRSTANTVAFGTVSVMYRVKAYDSEGLQSGWRTSAQITVINNTAPSAPAGITVPNTVNAGQPFTIQWGAAYDSDGNLSGYSLERQLNGGEWTEIYNGSAQSYTDALNKGWNTVAYRVRAYDRYTAFGAYTTSETCTVNNNTAPVISGQDAALGLKTGSFSQGYSITDAESDTVTVTEQVDGMQLRSYQPTLGQTQAITVPREIWLTLKNGDHELKVTASDGNAQSSRIWTFSKYETVISFRLKAPEETDAAVKKLLISPTWKTTGATVKIEACNNAFDDAPAWEDITAMVLLGRVYNFLNTTKTANKWGLDIRFTMAKNDGYDGEVSITGFGGAYE